MTLHKESNKDYIEKYKKYRITESIFEKEADRSTPVEETDIFRELRTYRWEISQLENVKPYFIYNDNQLKDLISKMPKTREELLKVSGFGEIKVEKYGADILEIIKKYI